VPSTGAKPGRPDARRTQRASREPAATGFAALAESHRRAGRAAEAARVARAGLAGAPESREGLAVLCLALLDQGLRDEAYRELEGVAGVVWSARLPSGSLVGELSEGELEHAFSRAETDPREVIDADRVAQEAIREARLDRPEGLREHPAQADSRESLVDLPTPTYATATMAELLERQGHGRAASRIRASLGPAPGDEAEAAGEGLFPLDAPDRRRKHAATLERWLRNLRGRR
jgi:hypothetical protein